jgi:hypothetical protein
MPDKPMTLEEAIARCDAASGFGANEEYFEARDALILAAKREGAEELAAFRWLMKLDKQETDHMIAQYRAAIREGKP